MRDTTRDSDNSDGGSPPPYDEPYDPLDNDYGPLPSGTTKDKDKGKGKEKQRETQDEPFDALDNEYDLPPQAPTAPPKRRGNDEPFDPLDNEYDPLPEAVIAEQQRRSQQRRSSFKAMAAMVRRSSYNAFNRRRSDDELAENDESYDPLGCDYQPNQLKTTVSNDGLVDAYVDLAPGSPPATPLVTEDVDPLFRECPPMNIVIFIVGSRGDVQPYVALALELIKTRGHRVRIATHGDFAKFVAESTAHLVGCTDQNGNPLTSNLEFFDIGGSPQELMAYMVRNPGLIPGMSAMVNGDIKNKRAMVKLMLMGCYRACFCPNEITRRPFAADAIISNPPAFAHIHVAEALGIPLLMSFTMPWTATTAFPHPLVKMKSNRKEEGVNNYSSFALADALMWQGLGDLINTFRYAVLGVRTLDLTAGPRVLDRLRIPATYAWSPSLLQKPKDWRANIDVVGFYSMPKNEGKPRVEPALVQFLDDGKPPIYIGFGSIVVKDPDALTKTIFSAINKTGVRAIISPGWANIGGSMSEIPSNVFIAKGDLPHDWLFAEGRVAAVCHHGGAGTTAAGLRQGVPTIVVPFFGDQWFWGRAVCQAGAGPAPLPHAKLTDDALAKAIEFALLPETREAAQTVGQHIREEDGVAQGVESFHKHMPLKNMRCQIDETRLALWWCEAYCARLSGAVAQVLVDEKILKWTDLRPHRPVSYEATRHYTDPLMALGQSWLNLNALAVTGTGQLFYAPSDGLTKLFWDLPKASFDVVSSFQEGLDNIPGMIGSPTRRRSQVTSFKTGMSEGVRGMSYGLWDGVTGLVTEPYNGARKSGVGGFLTGSVRGLVNLVARPAGGALGLVTQPATGAYRGARTRLSRTGMIDSDSVMMPARRETSHMEGNLLSTEQRQNILTTWAQFQSPNLVKMRKTERQKLLDSQEASLLRIDMSSWPLSEAAVEGLSKDGRGSFAAEIDAANREAKSEASASASPTASASASGTVGTGTASTETAVSPENSLTETVSASPSTTASTADLALAGTDRWDWSRPSSRASGGSFTAYKWASQLRTPLSPTSPTEQQ